MSPEYIFEFGLAKFKQWMTVHLLRTTRHHFFEIEENYARCDRISHRNVSNLFKRDGYRRELQFSLVRAQQTGWKKLRMKSSAFFNMLTPKLIHVERIAK